MGTVIISATPTNSPSGDGLSSGGGGVSGENYSNIEIKEKYDKDIFKDRIISYVFTNLSNPIMFVNITGNTNAGEITTTVEVLRSTSALVKNPAPGMVYKNINIWVGTSGFAIPKNIKESTITFRVNKSWLDENSIYEVILYGYSNGTWAALPTEKISVDEKHVYYRASTDHFSPFSIVGVVKTGTLPQPIIKSTPSIQSTERPIDAVTAVVTSTSESPAPNIELKIILMAMALVSCQVSISNK